MQDQFKFFNSDRKSKDIFQIDCFKGKELVSPQLEKMMLDDKNCKSAKKIKSNIKKPGLVLKPISELKQVFILPLPRESIKGITGKNAKHKPIKAYKTSKNFGNFSERSRKNEEVEDCFESLEYHYKGGIKEEEKLDPLVVDQNLRTRHLEANSHFASKLVHDFQPQNPFQSYPKNPQEPVHSFDKPIFPPNIPFPPKIETTIPNSSSEAFEKKSFTDYNTSPKALFLPPNLHENPPNISSETSFPISPQKIPVQIQMTPPKLGVPQPWSSEWVLSPQSKPQISSINPSLILNLKQNPSLEDQNYNSISEHPPLIIKSQGIILPNMHSLPPPPLKAPLTKPIPGNNQKLPLPMNNPIFPNIITPESKTQKFIDKEGSYLIGSENQDKNNHCYIQNKQDFFIPPPPPLYCPPVNAVPVINWSVVRNTPSPVVEDNSL